MPNLGTILIFAALATPSPTPAPVDPCGAPRTNLLAALNRPSVGFSSCSVKAHESVAELGYARSSGEPAQSTTYPQGFLRFGVANGLELDFIGPAYGEQLSGSARASGFFDSGAGAKYEIWHDGSRALAADFLFTAPTGTAAFTAGAPTETLNADYSFPLSSKFGFATTLGFQSAYAASLAGPRGRFFTLLPSAVVTDQWNPRAQVFLEAFGQTRTRPDGGAQFGMDAAFQYLLTPSIEIDLEAGRSASDIARAHYAGFGFGLRF